MMNDSKTLPGNDPQAATPSRPTYAATFQCIGSACEDTCCRGWPIPVDKTTYEIYRQFPANPLGSLVSSFISISPAGSPDPLYAQINPALSGFCPFFEPERLCGIQKNYGSQLLSSTCSIYPRTLNLVDGLLEGSLTLSCPEAARNILFVPHSTEISGDLFSGAFRTDNIFHLAGDNGTSIHKPYGHFHAVRTLLLDMVKDRSLPLSQRLLRIGLLCQSLDQINSTEDDRRVPALLEQFHQPLNPILRHQLENIPGHPQRKLDLILSLTNDRAQDRSCGSRFQDTYWTFIEGIGSPLGSAPGDDIQRFLEAERLYHRPFFEKYPFVMENYLINSIYQTLFPFGREGSASFTPQTIFDEYLLLATQFAWIDSLLIGVAGHYKQNFAADHVVKTIQSFCRATEHYPEVLLSILESIRSRGLNTLEGMAILLKT